MIEEDHVTDFDTPALELCKPTQLTINSLYMPEKVKHNPTMTSMSFK